MDLYQNITFYPRSSAQSAKSAFPFLYYKTTIMKRHLILSNQQLISLLERLGYQMALQEEVQYKCYPDQSIEPVVVSTLKVRLKDSCLSGSPFNCLSEENTFLLN